MHVEPRQSSASRLGARSLASALGVTGAASSLAKGAGRARSTPAARPAGPLVQVAVVALADASLGKPVGLAASPELHSRLLISPPAVVSHPDQPLPRRQAPSSLTLPRVNPLHRL